MESLLLRSAPDLEPPPSAQEEVWRRLKVASAVGVAAAATGIATQTAAASGVATSKIVGKALLVSVLKWGAVVAVAVPAAGITTHMVLRHEAQRSAAVVQGATTSPPTPPAPADSVAIAAPVAPAAVDLPKPAASPRAGRGGVAHLESSPVDAPSALKAESRMLEAARSKFAAGDYHGALDDVARLAAHFPHGRLAQEREVVAIDCLAAMNNRPAARARAQAFLDRFPGSPYAAHLRQLLDS